MKTFYCIVVLWIRFSSSCQPAPDSSDRVQSYAIYNFLRFRDLQTVNKVILDGLGYSVQFVSFRFRVPGHIFLSQLDNISIIGTTVRSVLPVLEQVRNPGNSINFRKKSRQNLDRNTPKKPFRSSADFFQVL